MVSGNQAGPKAPSESGKACPELQNVKKYNGQGGNTEISFHQHLKCDIFSQIGHICEFCDIVQLCAYLSNRGRLRRSFGGNFARRSGNTLGTQLTGVSPQRWAQRRWDAAETLAASTDSSEPGLSQVLCSVGANCLFLSSLSAGCQTEIQGCYRMALLPKTMNAPFFQGNGGWQTHNTFDFLKTA